VTRYGIQVPIRRDSRLSGFVWTLEIDAWENDHVEGGQVSWNAESALGELYVYHDDRDGTFALVGISGTGDAILETELGTGFESPLAAMREARRIDNEIIEGERRMEAALEAGSFRDWLDP